MNFGTLKALSVGKAFGIEDSPRAAAVNELVLGAFVNEAYHRIERAAMWKFSEAEATVLVPAGSDTSTTWPTDVALTLHLTREDGLELSFFDIRQASPPPRVGGAPDSYGIWGGLARVYPTPKRDTQLSLAYYRRWHDLEETSDEPVLPETWHELLANYAAAQLLLRSPAEGDRSLRESQARPFREEFDRGLAEMLNSPLVMVTGDVITSHALEESIVAGHGVDW